MTVIFSAQSVAFGCVAEPTPSFYDQVLRLVQSIRWFGGSLANADVFICFVGKPDVARQVQLEALGAQVRVVQPFNPLNRYSNKVRFLELPELDRYQTAVLLDCDMALVQDPAPYFAQPALQIKIADMPTVPTERLASLCAHFNLVAPAPIYRTTCSQEPTIWYCNTGVMILPTAWIARILPTWRDFILQLCAEPTLLNPPYNHCNQAAMALTYIADPLPFAELPVAMNFPLNQLGRRPAEALLREDPVILHYHDRVDADGLLLPAPYPLAQARIELLNERLRAIGRSQPTTADVQPRLDDRPAPGSTCNHPSGDQNPPMPFIIGGSHSGGALLRRMLNSHPELAIPPETHFIPDIARACRRAAQPAEHFVDYLTQQERWPDFQIDANSLRAAITALDPFTIGAGLRAFYRLYAARSGKSRYGDTTASYSLCAEQIEALLPEARFIHLIRDARDVALAHQKTAASSSDLHKFARCWAAQIRATRHQARELGKYLEVRYEDLVLEPETTLRRICEFLDLAWDPAILADHERTTSRLVKMQRREDWRRALSPADLAAVETEAGDVMTQLGYSLASERVADAPRPVAVCVTGMHRSGTSLVAQILHSCGPYLGPYRRLAAPSADNPDGYWEHPDFHQLNDEILAHFGGGWDVAPSLPAGWEDSPELEPLRQRARELIGQFADQRFWGWKDPRSALTMPFWRRLIPGMKVVICVRNPLEVAQSLSRRGMSSLTFGLRLWQTYYERLLAAVAPEDRIVTHYDSYFGGAAAETERILTWLGIPADARMIQPACNVAADELRHHRGTAADLLDAAVPAAVLQLYGRLCDEAIALDGAALDGAMLDDLADMVDARPAKPAARLAGAIALLREHESALAALRPAFTKIQTELAILQPVLQAREADVAFLQPTLAAREAEIASFACELDTAHDLLAARETEIAGFSSELGSTRGLLAAREIEIASFACELASMRNLLAARETEIAGLARELASMRKQPRADVHGMTIRQWRFNK